MVLSRRARRQDIGGYSNRVERCTTNALERVELCRAGRGSPSIYVLVSTYLG